MSILNLMYMVSAGMILLVLNSAWWLACDLTGPIMFKIFVKVGAVVGIVIPLIYFLQLFGVLN